MNSYINIGLQLCYVVCFFVLTLLFILYLHLYMYYFIIYIPFIKTDVITIHEIAKHNTNFQSGYPIPSLIVSTSLSIVLLYIYIYMLFVYNKNINQTHIQYNI